MLLAGQRSAACTIEDNFVSIGFQSEANRIAEREKEMCKLIKRHTHRTMRTGLADPIAHFSLARSFFPSQKLAISASIDYLTLEIDLLRKDIAQRSLC